MIEAGLKTEIDAVGNLTGKWIGEEKEIIAIGSHIDTVPNGGIYDGSLGVLAGIECLRTMKESGYKNKHTFEIIAFIEEEGNVIGGTFGSKCFTGQPQEKSTLEKLDKVGLNEENIKKAERDPNDYLCYLEYHIEQGGILENKNLQIGIVNGIVGIARYMMTVRGVSNHAGTTPMYLRDDALIKAAKIIIFLMDISQQIDRTMTCTIGNISVEPGAVNVIPGKVSFPVEFRCIEMNSIKKVIDLFKSKYLNQNLTVDEFLWQDATKMDNSLMKLIQNECQKCNVPYLIMPSGAGHDCINMARFTPSAMLFIPSINGISHSIDEYSKPKDIELGANILLNTLFEIDQKGKI